MSSFSALLEHCEAIHTSSRIDHLNQLLGSQGDGSACNRSGRCRRAPGLDVPVVFQSLSSAGGGESRPAFDAFGALAVRVQTFARVELTRH